MLKNIWSNEVYERYHSPEWPDGDKKPTYLASTAIAIEPVKQQSYIFRVIRLVKMLPCFEGKPLGCPFSSGKSHI